MICVSQNPNLARYLYWVIAIMLLGEPSGTAFAQETRLIAHRGGCAHAPENTLAAIRTGIAAGADFVEVDIHLSRDSVLVVHHDETVDRCTDGRGRIDQLTWAELQKLDAGSWFSEKFKDERIPSLDQVLELTKGKIGVFIEIKGYGPEYAGLARKLVDVIHRHHAQTWVEVISFDHGALKQVHDLDPDIRLQKLLVSNLRLLPFYLDKRLHWGSPKRLDFVQGFGYYHKVVDKALVRKVHRWGRQINAWTVNSAAKQEKLVQIGIDGITADDPGGFGR